MSLQSPKRVARFGVGVAASAGLLLLGGCSSETQAQVERLAMPEGATDRAPMIYDLWIGSWIAALAVGVVVWGLILYACFRFRRRDPAEVPVQTRYNLPIEILYTVAPVVMVLVLFYETVKTQDSVLETVASDDPVKVNVVGAKWAWAFNYMDEEAVDGQTVHLVGTPADLPTLYLPVDEEVRVQLSSPDVIHSFWVPSFLFKLDVIPGRDNAFSFTTTREGTFAGKCAELCGTYHSRMLFNVRVVSREEYDQHLVDLQQRGNTGLAVGGSDAVTEQGLQDEVQDDDTSDLGDAQ